MEGLGHTVPSETLLEEASSLDQADTSDLRKEGDEQASEELLALEVEGW